MSTAADIIFNCEDLVFEIVVAAAKIAYNDFKDLIKKSRLINVNIKNFNCGKFPCLNKIIRNAFDKAAVFVKTIFLINKCGGSVWQKIAAGLYKIHGSVDYLHLLYPPDEINRRQSLRSSVIFMVCKHGELTFLYEKNYPNIIACSVVKFYSIGSIYSISNIQFITNDDSKEYLITYDENKDRDSKYQISKSVFPRKGGKGETIDKEDRRSFTDLVDAATFKDIHHLKDIIAKKMNAVVKGKPDKFSSLSGAAENFVPSEQFYTFWGGEN